MVVSGLESGEETDNKQPAPAPPDGLPSEQAEEVRQTRNQQTLLPSLSEDEGMELPPQHKSLVAVRE